MDASYCLDIDSSQKNKFYCTETGNYPDNNYLEKLIKEKFPHIQKFFNNQVVIALNISQRSGSNAKQVCKGISKVIYPKSGVNKQNDWTFIVNTPQRKQGVVVEQCENTDVVCGADTGLSLPLRYTAKCEQKFIYRYLAAYSNATDTSLSGQYFLFPSCCKCVIRAVR